MRQWFLPVMGKALFMIMVMFSFTEGAALAQLATITGTATYRERIALRPGSVLEVELLDVSRQDVPSQRLASIRIKPSGQVPISFSLGYDPAMIEPNHTYAVSAKIILQSKIIFRSDTIHPVLTRGADNTVDILMVQAPGTKAIRPAPTGTPDHSNLIGPTWVAEDIAGKGVMDNLQSTITFTADGTVHGTGGCNRFHGGFTVEGEKLAFGQLANTSRACLPAIDEQEQRFHQALQQTRGYRIEKGLLFLLDVYGEPQMRLWKRD